MLFRSDVLEAYLLHHVNSRKSVLSEILLSRRFRLIPGDLEYYFSRLEQILQQGKLLYSRMHLYTAIHDLIQLTTNFKYVKIHEQDYTQVQMQTTDKKNDWFRYLFLMVLRHWYPWFGFLMTSLLGLQGRMGCLVRIAQANVMLRLNTCWWSAGCQHSYSTYHYRLGPVNSNTVNSKLSLNSM